MRSSSVWRGRTCVRRRIGSPLCTASALARASVSQHAVGGGQLTDKKTNLYRDCPSCQRRKPEQVAPSVSASRRRDPQQLVSLANLLWRQRIYPARVKPGARLVWALGGDLISHRDFTHQCRVSAHHEVALAGKCVLVLRLHWQELDIMSLSWIL